MKHILAGKPADLTVAWAQRVMDIHHPGAVVSAVELASVAIGTTTRVRLSVAHDGPQSVPRRWFVKLPSLDWRARLITALPGLLHHEVDFYQEAARHMPVTVPVCLAAQSRFGRGVVLVLADVTEAGLVPGQPGDALTVVQAQAVIERLARLHAQFWGRTRAHPAVPPRWLAGLAGPVRRLEDHLGTALAVPLMKRGLRLAGAQVAPELHAPALRYARCRRQAMRFLADATPTLIHHDCHPGNLYWDDSDMHPGFLDWQLVRAGEGVSDVAYFLATALTPAMRRSHENELLKTYCHVLQGHGVAGVDAATMKERYRAHLVYPLEAMVVTLAVGGMMDLEHNLKLIRRAATAVADWDAFSALPL